MKKETLLAILGEVLDEVKRMETDLSFENGDGHERNTASAKLATVIKVAEMETIEDSSKNDLKAVSSDFVATDDKIPNRDDNGSKKANTCELEGNTKELFVYVPGSEAIEDKHILVHYRVGDPIYCFYFKTNIVENGYGLVGTGNMFKEYKLECKKLGIELSNITRKNASEIDIKTFEAEAAKQDSFTKTVKRNLTT